jgi:hypothetical protein
MLFCYFVWSKGLITCLNQHLNRLPGSGYAPLVGNGRAYVLAIFVKSQNRLIGNGLSSLHVLREISSYGEFFVWLFFKLFHDVLPAGFGFIKDQRNFSGFKQKPYQVLLAPDFLLVSNKHADFDWSRKFHRSNLITCLAFIKAFLKCS